MTNILAVNLRELERRYLYASDAKEAVALLDGSTSPDNDTKIRELLRHHSQKPITSKKELRLRQAFDELLGFYSLVEVGCLAGFLEAVLPDYFATRAREHLSSAAVQKYYEQNYPLLLPRLLRKRAEKAYSLRDNESTTATSLYMQ